MNIFKKDFIVLAIMMAVGMSIGILYLLNVEYKRKKKSHQTNAASILSYIFEKIKNVREVNWISASPEIEECLKKEFVCEKCKSLQSSLGRVGMALTDLFSQVSGIPMVLFLTTSCQECGFTALYNYHIITKRGLLEGNVMTNGEACDKCGNRVIRKVTVALHGIGLDARITGIPSGKYDLRICEKCGFTEVHEVNRANASLGAIRLSIELPRLLDGFSCKKCTKKYGTATAVNVIGCWDIWSTRTIDFIFITCNFCKFVDVYSRVDFAKEISVKIRERL